MGITGLELLSLDDVEPYGEAPESGATFEDNAVAKARDGFAATGLPTLADDSGLEVAALNGMPGVLSAPPETTWPREAPMATRPPLSKGSPGLPPEKGE